MDINALHNMVEKEGIVFLTYGGFMSQALISNMTEALEFEAEDNNLDMSVSTNIFTIFIELAQNMMNYSKVKAENSEATKAEGLIVVGRENDERYYIHSQNIIDIGDKEKIEPKLIEIQSLDREGIKQRYKELRRSGANSHGKGGGIGFYEISKRCNEVEYNFKKINETKFYFDFKAIVNTKKEK